MIQGSATPTGNTSSGTHGLATKIRAVIFDTDGVVTRTATVHAAAWKGLFDEFLQRRAEHRGDRFVPFEDDDYTRYVDG